MNSGAAGLRPAQPVFGPSGRVGLIVPASNSVIEPELWSALPPGVALYATRIRAKGELTAAAVEEMEREIDTAVDAIACVDANVLAYCDMVTTFLMESGWNENTVERLGRSTGAHFISAWTALRDALLHLGIKRFALGTPYPKAIHALAPDFFARNGFSVTASATLDIVQMREVPTIGPDRLAGFVRGLDTSGCDAVVLLATDLPTFGCLAALEEELGRPVLTSNQTLLWKALSLIGLQPTGALGQLCRN